MRLSELFNKAADMGDHVIATTPGSKRPIYAGKGPAHEAYSGFTPADHVAAANVHASKAKDLHIASARAGGSMTMKRQAQQHSQFATMHRQAAEPKPERLAASMTNMTRSAEWYAEVVHKSSGAGSRGGLVIGETNSGKYVYSKRPAHYAEYKEFSADDHKNASEHHLRWANEAHDKYASAVRQEKRGSKSKTASDLRKIREHHFDVAAEHTSLAHKQD